MGPTTSQRTRTNGRRIHLNCPRCGLTITPRADWLAAEHCPRCMARAHVAVPLFVSTLPARELYAERPVRDDSRPRRTRPVRRGAPCGPLPEALSAVASGVSAAVAGGWRSAS